MDLIRHFPPEVFASALESWAWLPDLDGTTPRFASAFGDVFLESADGYWHLDTLGGTLTRRWPDAAAMEADLNTRDTQEQLLMPQLVAIADHMGLRPGEKQILSFKVPPALGGKFTPDNLEVADFEVTVYLAGQIHQQVKDLPPGAKISGINLQQP